MRISGQQRGWAGRLSAGGLVLLVGGLIWLALSPQFEIAVARNLLLYRIEQGWRDDVRPVPTETGILRGVIRGPEGQPLSSATVVAADESGRAFVALSDERGVYQLALPRGAYVPVATRAGFDDTPAGAGPLRRSIYIAGDADASADFLLVRAAPRAADAAGLPVFGEDGLSHTTIPQPADVRRRGFSFSRAGLTLTGAQLYEPPGAQPAPALLIIYPCWTYPCSVLGWDLLSATLSAQGYLVVAYSPQRGVDIEGDVDDLLALVALTRDRSLSARSDGRLALLTGSLTSVQLWRVAQLAPAGALRGIIVLGGISDLFLIRQRFEEHALHLEPPFAEPLSTALIGLGPPNVSPEWYVRYSPIYHLDALPPIPIALIHGGLDKTVPFEQATHFSDALRARGIAHDRFLYPDQEHYLDLEHLNPDERDMLVKVLGFLAGALPAIGN